MSPCQKGSSARENSEVPYDERPCLGDEPPNVGAGSDSVTNSSGCDGLLCHSALAIVGVTAIITVNLQRRQCVCYASY
jgi:hypothetical protein